jgi:hypothetical protein
LAQKVTETPFIFRAQDDGAGAQAVAQGVHGDTGLPLRWF